MSELHRHIQEILAYVKESSTWFPIMDQQTSICQLEQYRISPEKWPEIGVPHDGIKFPIKWLSRNIQLTSSAGSNCPGNKTLYGFFDSVEQPGVRENVVIKFIDITNYVHKTKSAISKSAIHNHYSVCDAWQESILWDLIHDDGLISCFNIRCKPTIQYKQIAVYQEHQSRYYHVIIMKKYGGTLAQLMPLLSDTQLYDHLAKIILGMLWPLKQNHNFCHNDLKTNNIVFKTTPKEYLKIKISNFYSANTSNANTDNNNDTSKKTDIMLRIPTHGLDFTMIDFGWSTWSSEPCDLCYGNKHTFIADRAIETSQGKMVINNPHLDQTFLCVTMQNSSTVRNLLRQSPILFEVFHGFSRVRNSKTNRLHTVQRMDVSEYVAMSHRCDESFLWTRYLDLCVERYATEATDDSDMDDYDAQVTVPEYFRRR